MATASGIFHVLFHMFGRSVSSTVNHFAARTSPLLVYLMSAVCQKRTWNPKRATKEQLEDWHCTGGTAPQVRRTPVLALGSLWHSLADLFHLYKYRSNIRWAVWCLQKSGEYEVKETSGNHFYSSKEISTAILGSAILG